MPHHYLYFDIETAPLEDAAGYLEPVSAPSNYKDEAKIASYIEDKTAEQLARCALDVDLCRVVAIGWLATDSGEQDDWIDNGLISEGTALSAFWQLARDVRLVGFHSLGFDLPVLIRRSQYLGVPVPPINLDRYRTPHIDLLQKLTFNGVLKMRSLAFYCKRFGIQVDDPVIDGSMIPGLVQAGEWDTVRTHIRADVERVRQLAERTLPF